ncbi:mucin-17-like isoform X1 [Quillaja saponaria]|uniref:Mucin-17-like isoform X1 n=1 Tax=Quillaja saponaria TaxID=32244 RepID=A0AAD7LTJ4_QUISA|nr:mucin-17-like isoform X1 [Quillaja saponaria]
MNRSLRAPESQTQAAFKQRQQQMGGMSMRSSVMKEKEEELALFLEMKKREKERNDLLLNSSEEFDPPLGSKPGTSPIFNISSTPAPARKTGADDFLNSDNDKNDYDWLLTPPGTPLFPSLEMESQKTVMSQLHTSKARPTVLKSRLANPQLEPAARDNLVSKQQASSPGLNSSCGGTRRPSSSVGPGSRPATPTGRSTMNIASKPSRSSTPTSRASLPSTKPTSSRPSNSAIKPMVSATKATVPASKGAVAAAKSTVPSRSSTPLSRSTARSSTPTARPTLPPTKSSSRASTPTRRPSTPSSAPSLSGPPIKSSPSISKPATTTLRNPVPSRGTSPTVKSRPWKPSEMPGFSYDAPPNLRTSVPERPLSATRGRPGAPTCRSSSIEPASNGRPRRQSCSPSRGRVPNGIVHSSGSSMPAVSRGHSKVNDSVNPVLIGSKMVERVINMRKLAPPKRDDKHSPRGNLPVKSSSSPDSSGFGRTLSKKSLDMAIRHMDLRRSIPGNLRPLMTNIPASAMYSVRSGPPRSRTVSVSDSPLATSSNGSSEMSVNNNGICLDSSEVEDDIGSERGCRSPTSMRGRWGGIIL